MKHGFFKGCIYAAAIAATAWGIGSCSPAQKENVTSANEPTISNIKDNQGDKLMPRALFPSASDSLIEALGLADGIPSSISAFLMRTDEGWSLFDTGLGEDKGGQLLQGLAAKGVTPDSIGHIYLTHFHGDHIGGMLHEGKPVFTKAKVHANHVEYMHWIFEQSDERNQLQRAVIEAYKDQLELFAWGDTLANGVVAISAPGHTPGHTVFKAAGNVLVIGDLMHGAALQMEHPEISCNYDMNPEEAAKSRIRILEMAKSEQYTLAGMHLPDPAFMEVRK